MKLYHGFMLKAHKYTDICCLWFTKKTYFYQFHIDVVSIHRSYILPIYVKLFVIGPIYDRHQQLKVIRKEKRCESFMFYQYVLIVCCHWVKIKQFIPLVIQWRFYISAVYRMYIENQYQFSLSVQYTTHISISVDASLLTFNWIYFKTNNIYASFVMHVSKIVLFFILF